MKTKIFLVASLVLNFTFIGLYAFKKFSGNPNMKIDRFMNARAGVLNAVKVNNNDIVFIGNSITEGFPVSEIFDSVSVKNRGVSSNTNEDILLRLSPILEGKPRKIFIMSGVNNLLHKGDDSQKAFKSFKKIAEVVKASGSELYIQSVLPISNSYRSDGNDKIVKYNSLLKSYAEKNQLVYIDLHSKFLSKNKELEPSLTYDGLHLTAAGYYIWSKQISSYVK